MGSNNNNNKKTYQFLILKSTKEKKRKKENTITGNAAQKVAFKTSFPATNVYAQKG